MLESVREARFHGYVPTYSYLAKRWITEVGDSFLARSLSKSCRFFDFRWFRPLASISWCWAVPFAPVVLLVHVFNDCPFVADHRERCCLLICSSSILKEQIRSSIRLICYLPPLYPIVTFLKAFTKWRQSLRCRKLSSGSVDVWAALSITDELTETPPFPRRPKYSNISWYTIWRSSCLSTTSNCCRRFSMRAVVFQFWTRVEE